MSESLSRSGGEWGALIEKHLLGKAILNEIKKKKIQKDMAQERYSKYVVKKRIQQIS